MTSRRCFEPRFESSTTIASDPRGFAFLGKLSGRFGDAGSTHDLQQLEGRRIPLDGQTGKVRGTRPRRRS